MPLWRAPSSMLLMLAAGAVVAGHGTGGDAGATDPQQHHRKKKKRGKRRSSQHSSPLKRKKTRARLHGAAALPAQEGEVREHAARRRAEQVVAQPAALAKPRHRVGLVRRLLRRAKRAEVGAVERRSEATPAADEDVT